MGDGFGIKITGEKELRRRLNRLASAAQRKIVRPAVNVALTPVNKAAKAKAPVKTGTLKKSLGKRVKAYTRTGVVWGGIGPRSGFKWVDDKGHAHNPVNYAQLVELGTQHSAAQPFLRPALDERKAEVLTTLNQKVNEGIQREIRRAK